MKYDKIFFIYNPSSGKKNLTRRLHVIEKEIAKHCNEYVTVKSKSREFFLSEVRKACALYDLIIFSGGDGTFNLAANAIKDLENLPTFAYLPSGTTCDMAYNLGISKNIKKGIRQIFSAKEKTLNIGRAGNENFVYVANLGSCSQAVYDTPDKLKKHFGKTAYALHILSNLKSSFALNEIYVNGEKYVTPLLLVSNSKEIASFKINEKFSSSGGKYYLVIIKKDKLFGIKNIVYFFLHGVEKSIKKKKIFYLEGENFTIKNPLGKWSIDGEPFDSPETVEIGFSGSSINVLSLK